MNLRVNDASNMKFAVIVVREFQEHVSSELMPLVDNFIAMGCMPENVVVKYVPTMMDVVVATQFMAQYTDVDAVVILAPKNRLMGTLHLMNGIVQVQVQWSLVVAIGGAESAAIVTEMVSLQNDMELDAPEGKIPRTNFS